MAVGSAPINRTFIQYRVVAKTAESQCITSLVLEPVSKRPVPAYLPGQHLVFRLSTDGTDVLRHYSISGDPMRPDAVRISVKRELAPSGRPDLPAGVGSSYMHDDVKVGDTLTAAGPVGDFQLIEDSTRPVLLFSGGVGLTPMLSMLHKLVRTSNRRVYFLHACENGQVHAFATEVANLARERDGIAVHFCYREPTPKDHDDGVFQSTGLVTRETLQAFLPLDDYDVYLCGPTGFMQVNWRLLRSLGIAGQRIHYEFFGPAMVLDTESQAQSETTPVASSTVPEQGGAAGNSPEQIEVVDEAVERSAPDLVSFGSSGVTVPWDDACTSLLELAEQAGLDPDFNCRSGLCNTCMSTLVSGIVDYFEEPLEPPPEGKVLLCCSRPLGPVEIELNG